MDIEEVARQIVDAAIKVHRALGPSLLESAYQKCLAYELRKRGLRVECEVLQPIIYEDVEIDAGYRIDMLVEERGPLSAHGHLPHPGTKTVEQTGLGWIMVLQIVTVGRDDLALTGQPCFEVSASIGQRVFDEAHETAGIGRQVDRL